MSKRLWNKVAVITGGSSGIGLATAKLFAEQGAKVFITGRRQDAIDRALAGLPSDVIGVRADSASPADLAALYAHVSAEAGHIDIFFANAGGGTTLPLGQITEAQIDETFASNVKGVILSVQQALPLMRRGGSIILTGSTTGSTGTPAFSVYSASKAAVRNLARTWALDLKDSGIRVNVLSPGATFTPGLVGLVGEDEAAREQLLAGLASQIPLGRVGRPEEIAHAALFLASDEASFVNGVELVADGGQAQV